MKKNHLLLIATVVTILLYGTNVIGQTLKADYQFQGNLNSSVGTAPALSNLTAVGNGANTYVTSTVDGYSRQVLQFPQNNGVQIPDLASIVPNTGSVTIVALFKFSNISGHRRLVDFSGGTENENGGFMIDGRIESEPNGSHAPTDQDSFVQITLVRGLAGVIAVYRDNVSATSNPDDGSPVTAGIRFFQDWAGANPVQASAGSIARLRVFDGPLTVQQIHQLDRVPETPSGSMPILLYSNRSGVNEMYRMNSDGSSQTRITNNEVVDIFGKFSPDGQKIAFQRRETPSDPFQIWISNADGSNPVRLTNGPQADRYPDWRPDGKKIIFSRCDTGTGTCDPFVVNPDGTGVTALFSSPLDEDRAIYTPDGAKLIFACSDQNLTNYQICVSNPDGTGKVAITNTVAPTISVAFDVSPDGSRLVCVQGSGATGFAVKTMKLDGSNVVTWGPTNNPQAPLWSPDGSRIMYTEAAGNLLEIFTANPDGTNRTRLTFNSAIDLATDWYRPASRSVKFDFDGDRKSDVGVFRASGGNWFELNSQAGFAAYQFGLSTDKIVPADYDGDAKSDVAVYRDGVWYWLNSKDSTFAAVQFGIAGDIPVPDDYTGDGRADLAVYRNGIWHTFDLSNSGYSAVSFGLAGDKPVNADFDGDGRSDRAVFRSGTWYVLGSTAGFSATQFGNSTDIPITGDFDGDGKADTAVFRSGTWFVLGSQQGFTANQFGLGSDIPTPADYDGDGKTDLAVFRGGTWFILGSQSGFSAVQFGVSADKPIPSAYLN